MTRNHKGLQCKVSKLAIPQFKGGLLLKMENTIIDFKLLKVKC